MEIAMRDFTMSPVTVTKHHGLGNDFLVLLCLDEHDDVPSVLRGAAMARHLCDRHRGIGADGLLVASRPAATSDADVVMRLHNADGSVAEMSGNGVRCFAQAVVDSGFRPAGTLRVQTDAGLRVLSVDATDDHGLAQVRVDMGVAKVDSFEVPEAASKIIGARRVMTVDVGNPHIVIECDPATVDIATLGPAVEAHFMAEFGGINVEVVAARDADNVDMVVWERGVGITQACGTGATASAIATHRWGLTGNATAVHQPGGSATVELNGEQVRLIGPSQFVATCTMRVHDGRTDAPIGRERP
jgi:diaminopimelate epimerase